MHVSNADARTQRVQLVCDDDGVQRGRKAQFAGGHQFSPNDQTARGAWLPSSGLNVFYPAWWDEMGISHREIGATTSFELVLIPVLNGFRL